MIGLTVALGLTLMAKPPKPAVTDMRPVQSVLPDGAELIVLPAPHAAVTTLRLVFRAGAGLDPPGESGLAHLLEHTILEGSAHIDGQTFANEARAAGAIVNAHTTIDATTFELEAPSTEFTKLASEFITLVTDPALRTARLKEVRGVVRTEALYNPESAGIKEMLEGVLFFNSDMAKSLAGTEESREAATVDELVAFYGRNYTSNNCTVIFSGDVTVLEARGLLEKNFRLPPALPGELSSTAGWHDQASLPVHQAAAAPFNMTALGYVLDPPHAAECESFVALLQPRVFVDLREKVSMMSLDVACPVLRGNNLLMVYLFGQGTAAVNSEDEVFGAFQRAMETPPNSLEQKQINNHILRAQQRLLRHPQQFAAWATWVASRPRKAGAVTDLKEVVGPARFDWKRLKAIAKSDFKPDRSVVVSFGR